MNFNKLYAIFCGISSLTIFVTYIVNYNDLLSQFTATWQRVVIGISSIGFALAIGYLLKNGKQLWSKDYRYTTLILTIIALLSMWFNWFLYSHI